MKKFVGIVSMFAVVAGCSKPTPEEQKKKEEELAAALASALGVPSQTPGAAATAAAPSGSLPVLATCNTKSLGTCSENYGMVPTMAADFCKDGDGVFTKGSTPCPTEGLTGKCEHVASAPGEPGETHFYYAKAVGDPKGSCEALNGKWTSIAAPKPTPAAGAGVAAKSAPPKSLAKGKK